MVISLLALTPSFTRAADGEAGIKETLKLMSDMMDVLKSVKDKASAEAALPKLKPIDERLAALMKKELGNKPSAEEEKQLEATSKAFSSELERVKKLPEVKALFTKELTLFKELEEARVTAAKAQIEVIDMGIQAYQQKMNQFPKAIKISPHYAAAHGNLGNLLTATGELAEATACYDPVATLNSGDAGVKYYLARLLRADGRVDQGIEHYRRAVGETAGRSTESLQN